MTLNFPAIKPFPGRQDATLSLSRLVKRLLLLMLVLYKEGKRWHIRAQKVANKPTCSLLYGSIQPQKSWRSTSAVYRESLVNPQCHLFLRLKLVNGGCISFGQQQMLQLAISPTCPDWRPVGWSRLFGLLQAIHQPSVATGGFKRCWQPASPRPRLHHALKQTGHVANSPLVDIRQKSCI